MFKYIIVGGDFFGSLKPSGYINKLYENMKAINGNGLIVNGGHVSILSELIPNLHLYDVIFWMPNVLNDEPKIVNEIKKQNPHSILITSKNNISKKYDTLQIVSRMLKVKANLLLEFIKNKDGKIEASILDPLGNSFLDFSSDTEKVASKLMLRVFELLKFTRVRSCPTIALKDANLNLLYTQSDFLRLVKNYADVFHKCIHAKNTERLLGNASFRCERGFPSCKIGDGQIFVSKRNIDKRNISAENFVPVRLFDGKDFCVEYYGHHKPSVDTAVQLLLYRYYKKARYMLHSHVYIDQAEITPNKIPCGAIEEFYEIVNCFPYRESECLYINLKGHGSIVIASEIKDLEHLNYVPRSCPEF